SSSACVFSSLASFWPRSAARPVRRILPDNFCLIFIGQTPVQRTGGARPLGCKVRDFSELMLTGQTTAELCMGERGATAAGRTINEAHRSRFRREGNSP